MRGLKSSYIFALLSLSQSTHRDYLIISYTRLLEYQCSKHTKLLEFQCSSHYSYKASGAFNVGFKESSCSKFLQTVEGLISLYKSLSLFHPRNERKDFWKKMFLSSIAALTLFFTFHVYWFFKKSIC